MKNKIAYIFLVLTILTFLYGCSPKNSNWRTTKINCGTFSVPGNWTLLSFHDKIYYHGNIDNQDKILAFQSESFSGSKDDVEYSQGIVEKNAFSNKFQSQYTISSNVNSNGAVWGEAMVSADGKEMKMKYLYFANDDSEMQLFVTEYVDEKTLIEIADSFSLA